MPYIALVCTKNLNKMDIFNLQNKQHIYNRTLKKTRSFHSHEDNFNVRVNILATYQVEKKETE